MARLRITKTKTTTSKFRKSKMTKDKNGNYHCPTCGAFKGNGKKK